MSDFRDSSKAVVRNARYGYYEVKDKPSQAELNAYYAQKYYQPTAKKHNQYQDKYQPADLDYLRQKIAQKYHFAQQYVDGGTFMTALDVGCGEGHALAWLLEQQISVTGIDYSDYGYQVHHPEVASHCHQGDMLEILDELAAAGKTFDLIWLDNVLEHLIDPEGLLQQCRRVVTDRGVLVIEVPNDYSTFQTFLQEEKLISRDYWFALPDHLNYFDPDSLTTLCQAMGWELRDQMGDFPIELFLLNAHSNYCEDRSVGKGAHLARMRFNTFLTQTTDLDQANALYQALLQAGVSRQIIGVYAKS